MIQPIPKHEMVTNYTKITGIDVSKYQGSIDFNLVKSSGFDFILIRATEGNTIQDDDYKLHYETAKSLGLVVGAYHFYETNDKPIDQFHNFIAVAVLTRGDLAPVVDIEKLHKNDQLELAENLKDFLDLLEQHYAAKPIVYTGLNFANKHLYELGSYPLWLAEYQVEDITLPQGWTDWAFWQWSQSSKTPGIDSDVDENVFNGGVNKFKEMLINKNK